MMKTSRVNRSEKENGRETNVRKDSLPIQGSVTFEEKKAHKRSGRKLKEPEGISQNVMVSAVEEK